MIGSVGDDNFAKLLVDKLSSNGICTKNISIAKNSNSGMAFIIRTNNDNRIIISNGSNHDIKRTQIEKILKNIYFNKEIKNNDIFITQLECETCAVEHSLKIAIKFSFIILLIFTKFL